MEEQLTLDNLIRGEHETREYKADIPEDRDKYLKPAVAFANGAGGMLIFGIRDGTDANVSCI